MDAPDGGARRRVAVVGSGIAGLAAAWLLRRSCDVTLFEQDARLGGHAQTIEIDQAGRGAPVDTGFNVYNAPACPNLAALLAHLGVASEVADMSVSVSIDRGDVEYAGTDLRSLFAQKRNSLRPRFLAMLADTCRFNRIAERAADTLDDDTTLGEWLVRARLGSAFRDDQLLPMASAIWSVSGGDMLAAPARPLLEFYRDHGLLRLRGRPVWRTVTGGAQRTVAALLAGGRMRDRRGIGVRGLRHTGSAVLVHDTRGHWDVFDDVVLACHAPDAAAIVAAAMPELGAALRPFRTTDNEVVVHRDRRLMPQCRAAWASWNVAADRDPGSPPGVTTWMNRLQNLPQEPDVFVTLNPARAVDAALVLRANSCRRPIFDAAASRARKKVWSMQGVRGVWLAGAWLGAGFHEDGLQAGLAVAEAIGGVARPWRVPGENARMPGPKPARPRPVPAYAAA